MMTSPVFLAWQRLVGSLSHRIVYSSMALTTSLSSLG